MGTITPNSTIYLLKGIPLDNTYDDTMYWESENIDGVMKTPKEVQLYHFMNDTGYTRQTITNHMYQRVGDGVIRVNKAYGEIFDYNYMIFQNSGTMSDGSGGTITVPMYTDKWFYAFINKVEYVNEQATNIYYEIDVIQTWYTEFIPEPCFVERETVGYDAIGLHILPEPVSCSEYTESIERPLGEEFAHYAAVLCTNAVIPSEYT